MKSAISIFDIAKKGLRRRLFRSCAIALSVALVAAVLFSVTTIMRSVEGSLKKGTDRLGADIMVVPENSETLAMNALLAGEPSTFYMDKQLLDDVAKIKGVKQISSQVFLKTLTLGCCTVGDVLVVAFDSSNDFTIIPWLEKELKKHLLYNEVVIGDELFALIAEGRASPDSSALSKVSLFGIDFTIVGMLDDTGMKFIDNTIFITYEGLQRIVDEAALGEDFMQVLGQMKDSVSTILVQIEPDADIERVAVLIEYYVPDVKAIVAKEVISSARKQFSVLMKSIFSVSIILWVMAFLLISVIFSMIVNERKREVGLLRAMGARKKDVFMLIINEASMLSVAGGAVGIFSAGLFLYLFRKFIVSSVTVPFLWPAPKEFILLIIVCLAVSFIAGTLAALIPAIRAAGMEPHDAIRKGE